MASNINTTSINTAYPVAGQDNDSQGFRDNFANTNTNFTQAKAEIEDIQNKVILKSALIGGSLTNDMDGAPIKSALLNDSRETVVTHVANENPLNLSVKAGAYHTITPNASVTIAFSDGASADWPATGKYSKIRLEVTITDIARTITLPASVSNGKVSGQNGQVITVAAEGTYVYEFSTRNAGTTVTISEISQPQNTLSSHVPASTTGVLGDVKGMTAFDTGYIYVCTADYDGVTAIWKRTEITTW